MIVGVVTAGLEARIPLALKGSNGLDATCEAVIDTRFTESLSLPRGLIEALELPFINTDRVVLADNSSVVVELYRVVVIWEAVERPVIAHCLEGPPLIGMTLLRDNLLTITIRAAGEVTVTSLAD